MSLLKLLSGQNSKSASVAKERLQLIIAHERSGLSNKPDFLPALQRELVAVVAKYVSVDLDDIKISLEKQGNYEVLEVNIFLPENSDTLGSKPASAR
jgi:cell division topological specificity factor